MTIAFHDIHEALHAQMGEIDGQTAVLHYGDSQSEEAQVRAHAGLIALPNAHTIELSGPDSRRFANGMFTNNIRRLQPGEGNRSAMCDDRGIVQGLLDIYCTEEDRFVGVLEGVTATWFEKRYEMYIVFDDVEMTVSNQAPWMWSLQGPEAAEILRTAGLPTPLSQGNHLVTESGIRVANKDRSGMGGFDLFLSEDDVRNVTKRLFEAGAVPMGHTTLDAIRIGHGRARWPTDGGEKSFVHELAINEEVCNFNKGCYLGQEIINRIDVKGQVNKRLTRIVVQHDDTAPIGSEVFLGDSRVGKVTSAALTNGQSIALVVLRKAAWEPGTEVEIDAANDRLLATVGDPVHRQPAE